MPSDITARLLYPDPFSPHGVQLELAADLTLTITISDADGSVLNVLLRETRLTAGRHDIFFSDPPARSGKRYLTIQIKEAGAERTIIEPL